MTSFKSGLLGCAASAVLCSSPGFAAELTAERVAEAGDIVVTATRRVERLQDVPLAVTAIEPEQLLNANYKNPSDLQYLAPSVQVSASGGTGFNIRGIGTNSLTSGTEQTVGMVVDGVIYGFADDISADLSDVERIEVLRGPQGTQFGKNASAGVVNITTARPNTSELAAIARFSYGSYNDVNGNLRVNIPLTEDLAVSGAMSYQNRDGWSLNKIRGRKEGGFHQNGAKAKLLWAPSDNFSVYVSADYRENERNPNFLATYRHFGVGTNGQTYGAGGNPAPPGFGSASYGIVPGPKNTELASSVPAYQENKLGGVSLEMNYEIGEANLTSITAYRWHERDLIGVVGAAPISFAEGDFHYRAKQYSQELRLTSPDNKPLRYVTGLYYYKRQSNERGLFAGSFSGLAEHRYGPGARLSFSGGFNHSTFGVESFAAFWDGTLKLGPVVSLIGGARLTHDRADSTLFTKPVAGVYPLFGFVSRPGSAETKNTDLSYRVGLKAEMSRDLMAYATYARGYKGPLAISVAGSGARLIDPETVNAYEIGIKSSFFDRAVSLNLALFSQKFKSFQTTVLDNTLVPPSFVLGNAGGLRSRGVEVELNARPVQGLSFGANMAYIDAKFTDFVTSCYSKFEPIPMPTTTDPAARGACYTIPGTTVGYTQAAGKPLPNASKWNVTLSSNYSTGLTENWNVEGGISYLWRSDFYTNGVDPNTKVDGYGILNANIGVVSADDKFKVGLFVRNALNKYYVSAIETGVFDPGALFNVLNPEARRTIGVSLSSAF